MTILLRVYLLLTGLFAPAIHLITSKNLPNTRRQERKGLSDDPQAGVIWVQAASIGETRLAASVIAKLQELGAVLVTTHSTTGAAEVERKGVLHRYAPADTPQAMQQFLDQWQPRIAVFIESDIPPNAVIALKNRAVPSALIAARSSKTRRRIPKTITQLLGHFNVITASSDRVANELREMGLGVAAVEDLKSGQAETASPMEWYPTIQSRPIWLAASVHSEDHRVVFHTFDMLKTDYPDALLFVAPRHIPSDPSWVDKKYAPIFHSSNKTPTPENQVYVIDSYGQLARFHAMTHVSYIGGALADRGGHSPWEAFAAGNHIVTGPNIQNNAAAYDDIPHQVIETADQLASAILQAWNTSPPHAPIIPASGQKTFDILHGLLSETL